MFCSCSRINYRTNTSLPRGADFGFDVTITRKNILYFGNISDGSKTDDPDVSDCLDDDTDKKGIQRY